LRKCSAYLRLVFRTAATMNILSGWKASLQMNSVHLLVLRHRGACSRMTMIIEIGKLTVQGNSLARLFSGVANIPFEKWMKVLRVADMWQMDELQSSTKLSLEPLFTDESAASKLRIAIDNDIQPWKYPALLRLVIRENTLNSEDLEVLGLRTAADVLQVRELDILAQMRQSRSDTSRAADDEIEKLFGCNMRS
jgi:hypothetical protein